MCMIKGSDQVGPETHPDAGEEATPQQQRPSTPRDSSLRVTADHLAGALAAAKKRAATAIGAPAVPDVR